MQVAIVIEDVEVTNREVLREFADQLPMYLFNFVSPNVSMTEDQAILKTHAELRQGEINRCFVRFVSLRLLRSRLIDGPDDNWFAEFTRPYEWTSIYTAGASHFESYWVDGLLHRAWLNRHDDPPNEKCLHSIEEFAEHLATNWETPLTKIADQSSKEHRSLRDLYFNRFASLSFGESEAVVDSLSNDGLQWIHAMSGDLWHLASDAITKARQSSSIISNGKTTPEPVLKVQIRSPLDLLPTITPPTKTPWARKLDLQLDWAFSVDGYQVVDRIQTKCPMTSLRAQSQ